MWDYVLYFQKTRKAQCFPNQPKTLRNWPDGAQWLVTTSNDSSGATWQDGTGLEKDSTNPQGANQGHGTTTLPARMLPKHADPEKALYTTSRNAHLVVLNGTGIASH